MANFLAPIINDQQENSNGAPLSGGTIEVYLAGSSTPATTYSDQAGASPNTWPITLNTLGVNSQGAVWLGGGFAYKFIIKDSAGVVQRTIDNIQGINDSTSTLDQWIPFQTAPTYVSATSFTVAGDHTQTFQVGRRIKTANTGGTIYSTITGSVYSAPNTTVTVRNDSGVLDSGLSSVSYGVLSVANTSLPGGLINYGQCRLVKSGANIVLQPFKGNRITINDAICVIPSAGVSLAPAGLVVGALYYIYAYMNAGSLTLEASTTSHGTDTTTGIEIKIGDPTRTLVGMARPTTGPAWTDSGTQRLVASWFNQRPLQLQGVLGADTALNVGSLVGISASFDTEFLTWSANASQATFTGTCITGTGGSDAFFSIAVDGAAGNPLIQVTLASAAQRIPVAAAINTTLSEGYHFVTMFGQTTGAPAYARASSILNITVLG